MSERKIPMVNKHSVQNTGRWTFHLQLAQTLQFHITPEQGTRDQIIIEGHDISELLDYLYDNRELIYEATHDKEMRRLEAMEVNDDPIVDQVEKERIERIFYFDDGIQRRRA
jgi:hypothetical protein